MLNNLAATWLPLYCNMLCTAGALMMPDDAKSNVMESSVAPRGGTDNTVDDVPRQRTDYCDARQLLSETLRLRRAAQLQRAAASETATATAATSPTAAVSGHRRPAVDGAAGTMATTPKRRKKLRHGRDSSTNLQQPPPPRVRRIMFHEYKGPSDDDCSDTITTTISGPMSAAQLTSRTSFCFTSPCVMTTSVSRNTVTSVWKDMRDGQPLDAATSQSFCSPLTTDFAGFRPASSSLPRFSELQRSLRSPTGRQDFTDLVSSGCHFHVTTQRGPLESVCGAASLCQRSALVDALFRRLTTAMTTASSPSTSSSVEPPTPTSQSRHCHPQSMTSPIDVTSGFLASGGADRVVPCFSPVTAPYRPNNGNKSMAKYSTNIVIYTLMV